MNNEYKVRYKYNSNDINRDLVCFVTEFMDNYILSDCEFFKTYLYNDLDIFSKDRKLQIAFRVPGATRGSFILERLDHNRFKIKEFHFNEDVCFGEFRCYKEELRKDINQFIGSILDFSDVELYNNLEVENHE